MPEFFAIETQQMQDVSRRISELSGWLSESPFKCQVEQKHLDANTSEQAYWHYGYLCALRDVVSLMSKRSAE